MAAADEMRGALPTYIPADRRQAMSGGQTLPDRQRGTVLFADIGGWTPLAEAIEQSFGPQRGAEELATSANGVFDALVEAVSRHHGSIVAFGGGSMTCWFEDGRELSAVAAALEMQAAMADFGSFALPGAEALPVSLKVALAPGDARRFMVGDPKVQLHDVVAGGAVDHACAGEQLCRRGEVMADRALTYALADAISVGGSRSEFMRVTGLRQVVAADPWPAPVVRPSTNTYYRDGWRPRYTRASAPGRA